MAARASTSPTSTVNRSASDEPSSRPGPRSSSAVRHDRRRAVAASTPRSSTRAGARPSSAVCPVSSSPPVRCPPRSSRSSASGDSAASVSCATACRIGAVATIEKNSELGRQIVEDAKRHVLYSWSVQNAIDPIAVAGAEGRYFWDYDGKRYLAFASRLVNVSLGHQHPKLVAAIKEQADKLCTIGPPMATEAKSTLARLVAEVTPGDLEMSFFTNGGAEANENAIKLARWYTGRNKILARYRSYHGATAGAITLTGDPRRWPAEPGIPGVVRMLDPYTYRCPAGHPDPC